VLDKKANWGEGSFENTLVLIDDYIDKVLKDIALFSKKIDLLSKR